MSVPIKRIFQRIIFYTCKSVIRPLVYVSYRGYVAAYQSLLKLSGMHIYGKIRYIDSSAKFDDFDKIYLGDNVIISLGVYFLTHDYMRQIAYDCLRKDGMVIDSMLDNPKFGDIRIGKNVAIGARVLVLPGTTIGDNCIIGAGSVIKGNIPSNSIVMGNPAQVVANVKDTGRKWLKESE